MDYISPFLVRQAALKLHQGGIVVYPTEAVFGIGCDPLNAKATLDLLTLKERPIEKGLILIAANLAQIRPYLKLSKAILERVEKTWPGPVTWVIPAQDWVPYWITGEHRTLAVRVSSHPCVVKLCNEFSGPIVSTSANPCGKKAAAKIVQVRKYFPKKNIYILNGQLGGLKQTTSIIDAVNGHFIRK